MSITLLDAKGPGITSDWIDVRPVVRDCEPLNFVAVGTFANGAVTIEASPTTHQNDWIALGTIALNGGQLAVTNPWERVRAKTAAAMTGTVSVYLIPDA